MREETAVITQDYQVRDDSMLSFVMSVEEAKRRVAQLQQFVREVMVKDEDYGVIPGTPKPTLLKPGAEKLCEIYGLAPTIEVINRVEDWEKGFFHYECLCRLISKRSGIVVAEGVGSANSKERRYQRQDPYTIVNTVLKMAKKRALVDSALSATRSSGLFTQDLDDMDTEDHAPADSKKNNANASSASRGSVSTDKATEPQLKKIYAMARNLELTEDMPGIIQERYGRQSSKELTKKEASDLIEYLDRIEKGAEPPPEVIDAGPAEIVEPIDIEEEELQQHLGR